MSPMPMPRMPNESDNAALGVITFGSTYATVRRYDRGRRTLIAMVDYIDGESAVECVKRAINRYRDHFPEARGVLRRLAGPCDLPNPGWERFGWTRETRPIGTVSVVPDMFAVL